MMALSLPLCQSDWPVTQSVAARWCLPPSSQVSPRPRRTHDGRRAFPGTRTHATVQITIHSRSSAYAEAPAHARCPGRPRHVSEGPRQQPVIASARPFPTRRWHPTPSAATRESLKCAATHLVNNERKKNCRRAGRAARQVRPSVRIWQTRRVSSILCTAIWLTYGLRTTNKERSHRSHLGLQSGQSVASGFDRITDLGRRLIADECCCAADSVSMRLRVDLSEASMCRRFHPGSALLTCAAWCHTHATDRPSQMNCIESVVLYW